MCSILCMQEKHDINALVQWNYSVETTVVTIDSRSPPLLVPVPENLKVGLDCAAGVVATSGAIRTRRKLLILRVSTRWRRDSIAACCVAVIESDELYALATSENSSTSASNLTCLRIDDHVADRQLKRLGFVNLR